MAAVNRFALVIGNGAYSSDWRLDSPPRDAKAAGAALAGLGFAVDCVCDLTFDGMDRAVETFAQKLKAAPRVEAALFYYSGHGCARERQNYMAPVDFDDLASADDKLIRAQAVIDRIGAARRDSFVKIVLFDACRDGDEDPDDYARRLGAAVEQKTLRGLDGAVRPSQTAQIRAKFTTMTGAGNTFIAFATAEGQRARGMRGGLSPFTAALVRHLDAVDLPLTNLLSRVRVEVGRQTGHEQNTWDQSSLEQPFFFNPASILLFAGNAMALAAFLLSLAPYSLTLSAGLPWTWTAAAAVLPLLCLAILLSGVQSVYTRLKGSFDVGPDGSTGWRERLGASLWKGALGGFLGSPVGGLVIGTTYYHAWANVDRARPGDYDPLAPLGQVLTEITIATAATACLLGALALAGSSLGWRDGSPRLVDRPTTRSLLIGATLGGVLAGLVAAPALTVYFGLMSRPDMTPDLLIPGSLVGAALIVFSIVNFDLERLTLRRIVTGFAASFAALFCGVIFAILVMGFFYLIGLVSWTTDFLHARAEAPGGLAVGGAIYGGPVGAILGFVIGVSAALTRQWSGEGALSTNPEASNGA